MKYRIYPPIGIARVGNSPDAFFLGPESIGSLGLELSADGTTESPVTSFKDANFRMKRQAARFQILEIPDNGDPPRPLNLPANSVIQWKVSLANKKDAIIRPPAPPDMPKKVRMDPSRQDRLIAATGTVSGAHATPVELSGRYLTKSVMLGEILTDGLQRLLVLGGSGNSETLSTPPAPIGADFYTNPDWHDDVSDGQISATISIPGQQPIQAEPSWLLVAPPDFAPGCSGIVTLYDVILQVAIDSGWVSVPDKFYFDSDIRPLIQRTANLRFVNGNSVWSEIELDWSKLSSSQPTTQTLRKNTANSIRKCEQALQNFELREWQQTMLDAWVAGTFEAGERPSLGLADILCRSALDGTVGQGFFPGIEAGINISNPSLYVATPFEFRFQKDALEPGDMTAHMALPWQADFLKCNSGWWPAQRPDLAPQASGAARNWLRPTMNHRSLVDNAMRLGVITPQSDGSMVEKGRDPSLQN
jgi:hypothetical protein